MSDGTCNSCWGSGWETQFVTPCRDCHGTGKIATITLPEKPNNPDKIFIDGDFNDSYESRVRSARGKKIEGLGNEKFDVHEVDSQNVEFVPKGNKRILKNGGVHDGQECKYTMCYSKNPDVKDKCLRWCVEPSESQEETQESMLHEIMENYEDWKLYNEDNANNFDLFVQSELQKFKIIRK